MQFRNQLRMPEILLQLAPALYQIIQYTFEISLFQKLVSIQGILQCL